MRDLRFPKRFDSVSVDQLLNMPVVVVDAGGDGRLSSRTYNNLDAAAVQHNGFVGYCGPFADRLPDGSLVIRFESVLANKRLSE